MLLLFCEYFLTKKKVEISHIFSSILQGKCSTAEELLLNTEATLNRLRHWTTGKWIDCEAIAKLETLYQTLQESIQPNSTKLLHLMHIYEQMVNNIRDSVIIMTNIFSQKITSDTGFIQHLAYTVSQSADFEPIRSQACNLADKLAELKNTTQISVDKCIDTFLPHIGFNRTFVEREALQLFNSYSGVRLDDDGVEKFNSDLDRVTKDIRIRIDTIRKNGREQRGGLDNCIDATLGECDREALSLWNEAVQTFNFNQGKKEEDKKVGVEGVPKEM